jgi:CheY-like chemotaxis protein
MKRILVVDDEPAVLLGICRSLRSRRADWEAVLALDAEEARARLDVGDISVLVCDLAMPGGGGEAVLRYAEARYPSIGRIVLSGKVKDEMGRRAGGLAHCLLAKPCPPDALQWAIGVVMAADFDPHGATDASSC